MCWAMVGRSASSTGWMEWVLVDILFELYEVVSVMTVL
jgi:hypothetical protein